MTFTSSLLLVAHNQELLLVTDKLKMLLTEPQSFLPLNQQTPGGFLNPKTKNIKLETGLFMETHSCPISPALSQYLTLEASWSAHAVRKAKLFLAREGEGSLKGEAQK